MQVVRTILALVIAVSVAMLPVTAGAIVSAKAAEMAGMSAMGDDCCPPAIDPCDKSTADRCSMAACALKCLGFSASAHAIVIFPSILAGPVPLFDGIASYSQKGSPPFRPPRA